MTTGGKLLKEIKGKFSWTKRVNFRGHFCPREVLLFLGEFSWTFLGEFSWTFLVNFRGHFFNSNN